MIIFCMIAGGVKIGGIYYFISDHFFIVVISHEFGHFIVAKKNRIHVVEFLLGWDHLYFPLHGEGPNIL